MGSGNKNRFKDTSHSTCLNAQLQVRFNILAGMSLDSGHGCSVGVCVWGVCVCVCV